MTVEAPDPPFIGLGWNDELEKHPEARKAITKGIFDVNLWLSQHASDVLPGYRLIINSHYTVFADIFPEFAGRIRGASPEYLPYDVEFGRFRGTPRDEVKSELERLAGNLEQLVQSLDTVEQTGGRPLLDDLLKVAAYAHCELIRIHPFGNGNGRVARLLINYFSWRYLHLPIPVERPITAQYLEANRAWLSGKDIEPMVRVLRPMVTEN